MKNIILLLTMMLINPLYAEELHLDIKSLSGGSINDGVRLARGELICPESHSMFRVWMNSKVERNTYIIYGKVFSNEIRVRLEGVDWLNDKDKHGIIKNSSAHSSTFNVVSDGNQVAAADEYILSISGVCN
ncbi:adhesin [Escherichia coli O4]|nr:adhesin [Escherichia coli]